MQTGTYTNLKRCGRLWFVLLVPIFCAFLFTNAQAFQLIVQNPDGALVAPYYWMVEEDNTNITVPGRQVPNALGQTSIGIDIHNSYAPVVAKGLGNSGSIAVTVPDPNKPYFVSVLPSGTAAQPQPLYGMSGTTVAPNQTTVRVTVNPMPTPTAQIFMIAFVDHNPISNAKDEREDGLGGVSVYLYDFSGGKILTDAFGNPLGTTYQTDIFGNPHLDIDGNPVVDRLGDGALTTVSQADLDSGDPARNPYNVKLGELLVKNLAPGKYGIRMVPPQKSDIVDGARPMKWVQTSTIEGTPTIDAWVEAGGPKLFIEGFGVGVWHAMFGFVNYTAAVGPDPVPWIVHGQAVTGLQGNVLNEIGTPAGTGTITGTLRFNHFDKPPNVQGQHPGPIVDQCWVGLNDANLVAEPELVPIGAEPGVEQIDALKPSAGLYAVPCNPDGTFTFHNVKYLPEGYQLVSWDTNLDALFGFYNVAPPAGASDAAPWTVNLDDTGPLLSFRWFGTLEGKVFNDADQDGFPDSGEIGFPDQVVNLRFRDGTIYQATSTGSDGSYEFAQVFPFFKWLIAEVDFARFKSTGATIAVDNGGLITSASWPANGNKVLQPQRPFSQDPFNENSDAFWRTETGPVLLEALMSLLNQTNLIDWGKTTYGPNENGGLAGLVFYDTTRAEDDPKYNFGEPWQPGIPRVQINLYTDFYTAFVDGVGSGPSDGIIDDRDGLNDGLGSSITLADVDNYPFGNFPGPEDIDRNYPGQTPGVFDLGDAVEFSYTDSWDDNKPSGCIQNLPSPHGYPIPECADAYGTWNQIRPGVFDGGYAFGPDIDCDETDCSDKDYVNQTVAGSSVGYLKTGNYIVEAAPPPDYLIVKSHDKNVDFGEVFIPSPNALPLECVGEEYTVADYPPLGNFPGPEDGELSLFPGVPANLAGEIHNTCDRKAVNLPGGNVNRAGVEFFMFTEVPKAARVVGFANNDLGAEFNQASPIYGEKLGVPWIPIAFRAWNGIELFRVYADEWGNYNAMLPSTYDINVPSPSGVGPNMVTMVLNDPIRPDGSLDPWHNPDFSVTPWTFNYQPGTTTYTDTPMVPVTAFTTAETGLDTYQVDGGPVISQAYATAAGAGTGPLVCSSNIPTTVTITSMGPTQILNPFWDPTAMTTTDRMITRDYGFGAQGPGSQVTLDGIPLSIVSGSWTDASVQVTIPAGLPPGEDGVPTGKLMLVRDNGTAGTVSTEIGVTLHIVDCATTAVLRVPSEYSTIQLAIDSAPYVPDALGPIILVAPGTYNENVIINKPVRLQGAGHGSTYIDGNPTPQAKLDAWHARIEPPVAQGGLNGQALEDFMLKNPFSENEAPVIIVFGEQFFPTGEIGNFGDFPLANVFNPISAGGGRFGTADDLVNPDGTARIPSNGEGAPIPGVAIKNQSLIDGFTLAGALSGGGIYVFTRARGLQISNNEIKNNQGNYAGGISVGVPDAGFQMYDEDDFRFRTAGFQNTDVVICNNKVHRNSGFQGAGGLALSEDSKRYLVKNNIIAGNFSRFHGGGIAHRGRSDGGVIKDNIIKFNENFFGAILQRAGDGGGIYVGGDLAGGTGAGSMTIDGNLIQGNMTGSGRGGGIRVDAFNGLDVRGINDPDILCDTSENCPDPWPLFTLTITNNIIVNNIAGLDGGGISLQDVSRAVIANNTIANNDSTQVGLAAFPAGSLDSIPAPAGISSHPYSAVLASLWQEAATQPLNPAPGKVTEYCIGDNAPGPACRGVPEITYTDPVLQNNIVWHNNSYFFNGDYINSAGALVGQLEPAPPAPPNYWDYGVQNGSAGQVLHPVNSLDSTGGDPAFVSEYVNTLQAATVIDELGNNINIRFQPFPGDPLVDNSDYHIQGAGSAAYNMGLPVGAPTSFAPPIFYYNSGLGVLPNDLVVANAGWYNATNPLLLDIDDQGRVPAPGGQWDIGADEYLGVTLPAVCPGDLNGDRAVNFIDLGILKANMFKPCSDGAICGDINADGTVNFVDLGLLKAAFLKPCP